MTHLIIAPTAAPNSSDNLGIKLPLINSLNKACIVSQMKLKIEPKSKLYIRPKVKSIADSKIVDIALINADGSKFSIIAIMLSIIPLPNPSQSTLVKNSSIARIKVFRPPTNNLPRFVQFKFWIIVVRLRPSAPNVLTNESAKSLFNIFSTRSLKFCVNAAIFGFKPSKKPGNLPNKSVNFLNKSNSPSLTSGKSNEVVSASASAAPVLPDDMIFNSSNPIVAFLALSADFAVASYALA